MEIQKSRQTDSLKDTNIKREKEAVSGHTGRKKKCERDAGRKRDSERHMERRRKEEINTHTQTQKERKNK